MPLDKKTFQLAKDPSPLIINFLKEHSESAYTRDELVENIPELINLGFGTKGMRITSSESRNLMKDPEGVLS